MSLRERSYGCSRFLCYDLNDEGACTDIKLNKGKMTLQRNFRNVKISLDKNIERGI